MGQSPGSEHSGPSVGNILGFALEFRDRRALLCLDRRLLEAGVLLTDYRAEIPNVRFPLQHPISAGRYRNRRCLAKSLSLRLDAAHLQKWLAARLEGAVFNALTVTTATLEFTPTETVDSIRAWCEIRGKYADGTSAMVVYGLAAYGRGTAVVVEPVRSWTFDDGPVSAEELWPFFIRHLAPLQREQLSFDPIRTAVGPGFVRAGWKAPNPAIVGLTKVDVDHHGVTLVYGEGSAITTAKAGQSGRDRITEAISAVRTPRSRRATADRVEGLERLMQLAAPLPSIRLATVQWIARSLRHTEARDDIIDLRLSALFAWLRLEPTHPQARRWLAETLAQSRRIEELGRLTEATRAAALDPVKQAQGDLGLALLLTDHLGDRNQARALLAPWLSELDRNPELGGLRIVLRCALARARVDTPNAAVRTLDDALAEMDQPQLRAGARLKLAAALIDSGAPEEALSQVRLALRDDASHPHLRGVATRLARALGTAGDLGEPDPDTDPNHAARKTVALTAAARSDPEALALLDETLAETPDDPDLLGAAAQLSAGRGELSRTSQYLLRLRAATTDPAASARLRLTRAEVLIGLQQYTQVWTELAPALDLADFDGRSRALQWAVEYAPAKEADKHVTPLIDALGPRPAVATLQARWERWQQVDSLAARLVDLLETNAETERARSLCLEFAAQRRGAPRVAWLIRAANNSPDSEATEILERGLTEVPGNPELEDRLETILERSGDWTRLKTVWRAQADDLAAAPLRRLRALDRLIEHTLGDQDPKTAGAQNDELVRWCQVRSDIDPSHPIANLVLAGRASRSDDDDRVTEFLERALADLEPADPARIAPVIDLAQLRLRRGDAQGARALLEPATKLDGREALWALLAETARQLEDDALLAESLDALVRNASDPSQSARLRLELAECYRRLDRPQDALTNLESATKTAPTRSELHVQAAEAWLSLAKTLEDHCESEAQARAELRLILGTDLPPSELRAEAMLWADRLGDASRGLSLIEEGLRTRPADEILLSASKDLGQRTGNTTQYLEVLRRAIDTLEPGRDRDHLIVELALCAVDTDDPDLALQALDRLTTEGATSTEALDLRDWAVDRLGRADAELEAIDERLAVAPDDPAALARLERVLGDPSQFAEHLVRIAANQATSDATALMRRALEALRRRAAPAVVHRVLRRAMDHGITLDDVVLDNKEIWSNALATAISDEDEALAADLIALARDARAPMVIQVSAEEGLDDALAQLPAAPHLHRLLWIRARETSAQNPENQARDRLRRICDEAGLSERDFATLIVAFVEQLPRDRAAEVLAEQAQRLTQAPDLLDIYSNALARLGHVPQLLRILEHQLAQTEDDADRVHVLKRLAHLHADAMSDPELAIDAFSRALELAPHDPDLLLPLLDHHFDRKDLPRAIELATRVLDHVAMGDAAFIALAHRAADAALTLGESELAVDVLKRAANRAPDDHKTQQRLAETEAMQGDPSQRVELLGVISDRQSGSARVEALEERARLLVDPLERIDEAIATLETLLVEAPHHEAALTSLIELYPRKERWRDLSELLEGLAMNQHGAQRCATLRQLATLYREHLFDSPRAEHTLRVALDHLGDDPQHQDLAEAMREELVSDLEAQGRYVDLSIYLERALAPELQAEVDLDELHPTRANLLVSLARIYRGPLDDESKAGRVYERLEQLNQLPDEGLATLARVYHRNGRHADLVRILGVRARALEAAGEELRKAAVDQRIAELLEGPLGRPHEAATYYLDAYLADPKNHATAGARARILLSGTDAIANVRGQLTARLEKMQGPGRPVLLALLGDVLSPHEEHEAEAEAAYRESLELSPDYGPALEALGRFLARQGRLAEAVEPLVAASRSPSLEPAAAAENAAVAARALLELDRAEEAEDALKGALQRAPDSQRALLELARLYERTGRPTEQAIVLESLSELPVSSMLAAEVAYRRATLLMPAARKDAYSSEAERARAYLLQAVSSDAKHVAARQALMELAEVRLEWSVVAHMHYLAIREQPPGAARGRIHLDLAETYLDHLGDTESAARNIESALAQAPDELVLVTRAGQIAARLPDPKRVADRFERIASTMDSLDDAARARLWLLAADLRMNDDDVVAAEAASQRVLDLQSAPEGAVAAAQRNLDALAGDDVRDLRQHKSGLLRLLKQESVPADRLHILGRLRDVGLALGDSELVEWTSREQLEIGTDIGDDGADLETAVASLRDILAERGEYDEIVRLYERVAATSDDPPRRAAGLRDAAAFAWSGLRSAERTTELLQSAITLDPKNAHAYGLLTEVAESVDDSSLRRRLYDTLQRIPGEHRTPSLELCSASLAMGLGRIGEGLALLRPLSVQRDNAPVRLRALQEIDRLMVRTATVPERLPALKRYLDEALDQGIDEAPTIAYELAQCELEVGDAEQALSVCGLGLEQDGGHLDLLRLRTEILRRMERWPELAAAMEALALQYPDLIEQAEGLVNAARVWRSGFGAQVDADQRARARAEARRLLTRACSSAPTLASPRADLLPIEFADGQWDRVLRLGLELQEVAGDDDEPLILVALTQAFRHGQRSLAKDLGFRFSESAHHRFLFPGLQRLLSEVATAGPLPRLDALLAAAASLCGGRVRLDRDLKRWAVGKPLHGGTTLGLARLAEANGEAERARHLYQLAAFMLTEGPVPSLVGRLPLSQPPAGLAATVEGPLGRGSSLRTALVRSRDVLLGLVGTHGPPLAATDSTRFALADTMIEPWRRHLRLPLPLRWTDADIPGGVVVWNTAPPIIIVGRAVAHLAIPELRFRLAWAATTIAMGLAILDSQGATLAELLDGLGRMASPAHEPVGEPARRIADRISAAGLDRGLSGDLRTALVAELRHWLGQKQSLQPLVAELCRLRLWFATRLSGHLDGGLFYLGSELGLRLNTGPAPRMATLQDDDAQWLIRRLDLFAHRQ